MLVELSKADLQRLADIVRDLTGNNIQEKNFSMLKSRLSSRLIKLGFSDIDAYWKYYEENEIEERSILQGLMTTHYTFFLGSMCILRPSNLGLSKTPSALKKGFMRRKLH